MGSFAQGALIEQKTSTVTSGSTTVLDVNSTTLQRFTGNSVHTVQLPDATNLVVGRYFIIENESNKNITINYQSGAFATYLASGTQRKFELYDNSTLVGDWVIGNQVDLEGPLSLHATRPHADHMLNISSNQIIGSSGTVLSISPIEDVINLYPDTSIDMAFGAATGGVSGGDVVTQNSLSFTRPSVTVGEYVRLIFTYLSASNKVNTLFSTSAISQSALENAGTLFTLIEGSPIGYIDLKSEGTYVFSSASSLVNTIENGDIIKFATGVIAEGSGDKSFKFQSVSGIDLKVKAGSLILNDGRELYAPLDFTIDLSTVASINGNYYGYVDTSIIPYTAVNLNGRKVYLIDASHFVFLTTTPDFVNLTRYVPIGTVQRIGGVWQHQQTLAHRRHDNIVMGVDSSLEFSQQYTIVGDVGDLDQIRAGHLLDIHSFPSLITSSDISWYGLINPSDSSTNLRDLTSNGAPDFTGVDILGVADCFAPDGLNDYLSSTDTFFAPSTSTDFAFGLWLNATNYTLGFPQGIVSNWGTGNKSYKLQLSSGALEFVTSSDGTSETTTFIYNAALLSGWNHFVVTHSSSSDFSFYLNGQFLLTANLSIFTPVVSDFNLAASGDAYWFAGLMDEFFFISGATLISADVVKLYSTKIVHNRALFPTNQKWLGWNRYITFETEFSNFAVDVTLNNLYANFSVYSPTDEIALKLINTGTLGVSKPVKARTLELTASELDALMPLNHWLYDVPFLRLQVDNGGSQFKNYDDSVYFLTDTTQIVSTGTTLSSAVGGGTKIRFTYSVGGDSINSRLIGRYIIVGNVPDSDFVDIQSALNSTYTIAGSRLLVMTDQTITSPLSIYNDNLCIEFLPNVKLISTIASGTSLVEITGNANRISNMWIQGNLAASLTSGLEISGSDNQLLGLVVESINVALTVTNAVTLTGNRNTVIGERVVTAGLITNKSNATVGTDNTSIISGEIRSPVVIGAVYN